MVGGEGGGGGWKGREEGGKNGGKRERVCNVGHGTWGYSQGREDRRK